MSASTGSPGKLRSVAFLPYFQYSHWLLCQFTFHFSFFFCITQACFSCLPLQDGHPDQVWVGKSHTPNSTHRKLWPISLFNSEVFTSLITGMASFLPLSIIREQAQSGNTKWKKKYLATNSNVLYSFSFQVLKESDKITAFRSLRCIWYTMTAPQSSDDQNAVIF